MNWLDPFQAGDFGYDAFFETIGTVILGRVTYEQVRGLGNWPYAGKRGMVLSSTPLADLPEGVEQWWAPVEDLVSDLQRKNPGDIWMVGGARTIGAFLDLGAVDEMALFVMPLLLGDGIPLFGHLRSEMSLRLRGTQRYASGVVKLVYGGL